MRLRVNHDFGMLLQPDIQCLQKIAVRFVIVRQRQRPQRRRNSSEKRQGYIVGMHNDIGRLTNVQQIGNQRVGNGLRVIAV